MRDFAKTAGPLILCLAVGFTPLGGSGSLPARPAASPGHALAAGADAPSGLASDRGTFKDLVNGKQVGTENFAISRKGSEWIATDAALIRSAKGPDTRITSTLRLRSDGTPVHYEWAIEGPKRVSSTIDFDKGTATMTLQVPGGRPFTQQFFFKTPRVAILDDNFYYQYAILASLYDWSKKGPQTVPVLIPQERTPGTVTLQALDSQNADGKDLARLEVSTPDLQVMLYFHGNRLVRVSVPSANAEIVRE